MDPERRPALSLLLSSPRVAPGLLSAGAWDALRGASEVLAADPGAAQPTAVAAAGVAVSAAPADAAASPQTLARHLLARAATGPVVWIGSPDGDPGLAEALAVELPEDEAPELELLVGSWDTPGSRLLDAVAVMDRLRSPGGCPWDARQTHASLTPYLIEEAHEAAEALEVLDRPEADRDHAVEELGDVLLQVLFHSRVAAEHEDDPFDIDDVAAGLVEKLVRRHPHVFADVEASTPEAVEANWEQIKAEEKSGRTGVLDGIPGGMPELARAVKVASRLRRAGRAEWLREWVDARLAALDPGALLLDAVLDLHDAGADAPAALRQTLRDLADQLPGQGTGDGDADPH
ncbi:nucleoside triphosphate pyrophosphohydrolase [Ornithinimicrobium humiphilum]|uniref:XTP/dITP diphosphohydrolase n=1 Tax=Ornithinimicrobium humiphilum TaxID=125288 RepID=A0A543KKU4_9MICO|nr:MazG family protein [Ornithinimicrobium humiphilum]TQM95702.1 XTP/dITP diphosphohydrolase [Ornithinimicrobium humiphilum]